MNTCVRTFLHANTDTHISKRSELQNDFSYVKLNEVTKCEWLNEVFKTKTGKFTYMYCTSYTVHSSRMFLMSKMRLQNIQDSNFYSIVHLFHTIDLFCVPFVFTIHCSHAQCAYACCQQPILLTARNVQNTIHLIWSTLPFFESFYSLTVHCFAPLFFLTHTQWR